METKFQNLKIAITDNDHLKAVCDVLESMGYKPYILYRKNNNYIHALANGYFMSTVMDVDSCRELTTLSDPLKMRDEMVKDNAKSSQE